LDDIPLLVDYFAHRVADKNGLTYLGIDDQALRLLEGYPWPGNVRELRNVVETMVTLERGQHITADMALRYLPVQEDVTVDNSAALVRIGDPQPSASAADLQMLYRTMLQLAGDVNEMKTVLRHLLSITFDAQQPATPTTTAVAPTTKATVEEDLNLARIERTAIELALRKTHGSRRDAAKLLGISERTLYRKIDDYGLQ
jgi:DNA-binding NtrC family response regulator